MDPTLEPVFRPESVAVIGASRNKGTIGYQIVDNLISHGFSGVVYPVNPKAKSIHSIRAYPSITDVPGPVDMAVVVVPKEAALQVVDECGQKGVKAVVVITAGSPRYPPRRAAISNSAGRTRFPPLVWMYLPICGINSTREWMWLV